RRPYPPLHRVDHAWRERPEQRILDSPGVWMSQRSRAGASAVDGGAAVDRRRLRAERIEAPEQAVAADRGVLGDADLHGERLTLARGDRLRAGAVEDVHFDLACRHELLHVRGATSEADGRPRGVLKYNYET